MKVAVCISGHVRNLAKNVESLKKHILDLHDCDIFCSTWDTYGWRVEGNNIDDKGGFKGFDYESGLVNHDEVIKSLNPKTYIYEHYPIIDKMKVAKSVPYKTRLRVPHDRPENSVSQAYKMLQCNMLKKNCEMLNGFKYDAVVKTRFDIKYHGNLVDYFKDGKIVTPICESYDLASDLVAIGNSKDMDSYSSIFEELDNIFAEGCLMNGHNIFKHFLDNTFPNAWTKENLPISINREK